jgi:hypothetical protein
MFREESVWVKWCAFRTLFLSSLLVSALTAGAGVVLAQDNQGDNNNSDCSTYSIGLWGDLPYSDVQATVGVPNMIADMNKQDLAFTAHDGDLKAGNGTPRSITPTRMDLRRRGPRVRAAQSPHTAA